MFWVSKLFYYFQKKYTEYIKLNDGNHKQCIRCNEINLVKDNYCLYCGNLNPK